LSIEKIFPLVEKELQAIEEEMTRNLVSEIVMIPTVSRYLIASGGKRFRPMLLILCAKLCGYQGPRTIPLAGTIEFIHTATLLHDDVVDRAFMRRGMASANSVWGDGASVLVGDFLFTKSFWLMVKDGNLRILDLVSYATTRMAEGEVMQLVKMGNPQITEEDYYYVVINKTAVLISAACQVGAILGGSSPERERALGDFGLNLGIAFQLMDDILDYISAEEEFGKTIGKDLSEGKITLPLIYTLRTCSPEDRNRLSQIIQDPKAREGDLKYVLELVKKSEGIDYTIRQAETYAGKAISALADFPSGQEKEALLTLAEYTLRRKK
jgi:octaprenyl-diphosphate synthase